MIGDQGFKIIMKAIINKKIEGKDIKITIKIRIIELNIKIISLIIEVMAIKIEAEMIIIPMERIGLIDHTATDRISHTTIDKVTNKESREIISLK